MCCNKGVFIVKELSMKERPVIRKCFSEWDNLFYNPAGGENLDEIMLYGQVWGIFRNENIVACSWLIPADSAFFRKTNACWEISDLMNDDLKDCMIAGYVWQDKDMTVPAVYSAFIRLWIVQSAKMKKNKVVHYSPLHIYTGIKQLFESGWKLKGLRGLDNLVPHYIFERDTELYNTEMEIPRNPKICHRTDTKQLSYLCEQNWQGVAVDRRQNIYFQKGG